MPGMGLGRHTCQMQVMAKKNSTAQAANGSVPDATKRNVVCVSQRCAASASGPALMAVTRVPIGWVLACSPPAWHFWLHLSGAATWQCLLAVANKR